MDKNKDIQVCIIIPCYNESKRLPITVFEEYIEKNAINFCFIDDGSKDKTFEILAKFESKFRDKVLALQNVRNYGKAETIRAGMFQVLNWKEFDVIGYFDADLASPLDEIQHILEHLMRNENYSFSLGSRIKRLGTEINRRPLRHILGRVFATLASEILEMPVYDTQCGAKIMKKQIIAAIFKDPFISKWLFDVELIARAKMIYSSSIFIEVPLKKWTEIGQSNIKMIDLFKLPLELFKIRNFINRLKKIKKESQL